MCIRDRFRTTTVIAKRKIIFINEKKILFITTGLLKYTPSYEALIGVLSHEIGHLQHYHISKRIDSIQNLKSLNKLGTLSVIATSILANNPNYLLQTMTANQIAINNYYSSFSKEQEREADIYAAKARAFEWDIAAGHAIVKHAGGIVTDHENNEFKYGKENFKNLTIIAKRSPSLKK